MNGLSRKNRRSFIFGAILLICAMIYSEISSALPQKTMLIKSKSGWVLTVNGSKSIISDSTGKMLGYINVDETGKATLTVTSK